MGPLLEFLLGLMIMAAPFVVGYHWWKSFHTNSATERRSLLFRYPSPGSVFVVDGLVYHLVWRWGWAVPFEVITGLHQLPLVFTIQHSTGVLEMHVACHLAVDNPKILLGAAGAQDVDISVLHNLVQHRLNGPVHQAVYDVMGASPARRSVKLLHDKIQDVVEHAVRCLGLRNQGVSLSFPHPNDLTTVLGEEMTVSSSPAGELSGPEEIVLEPSSGRATGGLFF